MLRDQLQHRVLIVGFVSCSITFGNRFDCGPVCPECAIFGNSRCTNPEPLLEDLRLKMLLGDFKPFNMMRNKFSVDPVADFSRIDRTC